MGKVLKFKRKPKVKATIPKQEVDGMVKALRDSFTDAEIEAIKKDLEHED